MSCGVGGRRGSDLTWLWLWLATCISDWTPILGTSISCGCGPKKKKKKRFISLAIDCLIYTCHRLLFKDQKHTIVILKGDKFEEEHTYDYNSANSPPDTL